MAYTNIFAGNLTDGIVSVLGISLLPGHYIKLTDRVPVGAVLQSPFLIHCMQTGVLEVRAGGPTWDDSDGVLDMPSIYDYLTDDEKSLGVAPGDVVSSGSGGGGGGGGINPPPKG